MKQLIARSLKTSRERPKSAPYLRLKNSQSTFEYSLLQYPHDEIFLVSGKSHSAKNVKGGTWGVFEHPFFCKIEKKLKGGPYGDIKKIAKKSLTKPK